MTDTTEIQKGLKKILWTGTCQQTVQSNRQISRNLSLSTLNQEETNFLCVWLL